MVCPKGALGSVCDVAVTGSDVLEARWGTELEGKRMKSCSESSPKLVVLVDALLFGVGCLGDWGWESHDL